MESEKTIENFCQNVRLLRLAQNLTENEMADIMDIGVDELRRIEKLDPKNEILSGTLCRVCDYFHISSDLILQENWVDALRAADRRPYIGDDPSPTRKKPSP